MAARKKKGHISYIVGAARDKRSRKDGYSAIVTNFSPKVADDSVIRFVRTFELAIDDVEDGSANIAYNILIPKTARDQLDGYPLGEVRENIFWMIVNGRHLIVALTDN